jgi:hypothetical protein
VNTKNEKISELYAKIKVKNRANRAEGLKYKTFLLLSTTFLEEDKKWTP